ncbi:thiopeptide-type bacteriocin biosynthesis protein [Streptomyces sp. NPDC087300]|uniref:thiopeptide-type bacteriocin biosynthesis protein n=1 Tax=Streptomyces sp. NPDC087300 TaxID=3365780 RepID=UPI0037FBE545
MHDASRIEDAVLAVLGGASVDDAARAAGVLPGHLTEAIEIYRAAGRAALDAQPSGWQQANIHFADYPTAAGAFRGYIAPALHTGPVGTWWFVRKYPHWRLRYHPAPGFAPEDAISHVTEALDNSVSWGVTSDWQSIPYEPETIAFGGSAGISLAHELFHTDSVSVLGYLHTVANGQARSLDAKTISLVAMTLLMRAAGLEFGEQGDVWGRVEECGHPPRTYPWSRSAPWSNPCVTSSLPTLTRSSTPKTSLHYAHGSRALSTLGEPWQMRPSAAY